MKRDVFKIVLFLLFWMFTVGVFVTTFTPFNGRYPLKGAVILPDPPKFQISKWFTGDFQEGFEKYFNDNIGFRPWMVRLRNQISWTLFDKAYAAGVIRGKENYLFELNYIKAYNGDDFIGTDSITLKSTQILLLNEKLAEQGKKLIVAIAPGKGTFYPEYFPEDLAAIPAETTNYKEYVKEFNRLQVPFLDFNQWFLDMKETAGCSLYPKYGIHWSYYGMLLATDSLIHRIENLISGDLPDIQIGDIQLSKNLDRMDYDIADGMNLIFQLSTTPMCYPAYEWEDETGKQKPKVLVIGDSFYWSMFNIGLWTKSFSPGGFWFYNRQVYPESFTENQFTENTDRKKVMEETDVFILLVTEANLPRFPWGFVTTALNDLDPSIIAQELNNPMNTTDVEEELKLHMRNIRADKNWMKDIERKARDKNISVDSMLKLDALWMMEYKKSQKVN